MVAEEPSVLLQPSRGQHRQPGSQMLSRWWGSACRMEGTRREHWAVGSGVQIAVRYCRVPTSVGSDAGEHRPTAWFSLHGSEFVFPSDLQHTWNSQPVSVCWCWLAAQQSAQHPLPGAVKRMNVGDLREYNKVKGLLAPKFNMTHKTTVEKKIYIYMFDFPLKSSFGPKIFSPLSGFGQQWLFVKAGRQKAECLPCNCLFSWNCTLMSESKQGSNRCGRYG